MGNVKKVDNDIQTFCVGLMLVLGGEQLKPLWDLQPGINLEHIFVPHIDRITYIYKAFQHPQCYFFYITGIKNCLAYGFCKEELLSNPRIIFPEAVPKRYLFPPKQKRL